MSPDLDKDTKVLVRRKFIETGRSVRRTTQYFCGVFSNTGVQTFGGREICTCELKRRLDKEIEQFRGPFLVDQLWNWTGLYTG